MPIVHPRPGRTALLAGCQWFLENFPQLSGGGVLIAAGATIAEAGAPASVALPIGLLSTWPLGVVVRETVHSVHCWRIRHHRRHAEQGSTASDQRRAVFVSAERAPEMPPAELEQARPAELAQPGRLVIEGETVPPAVDRRR